MTITYEDFETGRCGFAGIISEEQLGEFLNGATDLEKHEIYHDASGNSDGYSTFVKLNGIYMFTWFTGPDKGWKYVCSKPVRIRNI